MTDCAGRLTRWAGSALLVTAFVALTLLASPPPAAHAAIDADMEAEFIALVNVERARNGLNALVVRDDIRRVARTHSVVMADRLDRDVSPALHHNPDYSTQITGWQVVAENVGRGPSVESLHNALMNSPGHRRNILEPRFTEIGVGVEVRHGRVWVTQNFRLPRGDSSSAPPSTTTFGDVPSTNVHSSAILDVAIAGIAEGCSAARFCPNDSVTRGDFAGMLARAMGLDERTPTTFRDVPSSDPNAGFIQALFDADVTRGITATTFDPNRRLSREQLGSFFARALALQPRPSPFRDVSTAHDGNVGALHVAGVVNGYDARTYGAPDPVTRAQTASMLSRQFQ